jgi:hypothetical protein
VAAEQDRAPEVKAEIKTETGVSSWWPPNWRVQFPKSDHPVSPNSGQKKASRTTTSGTALGPHRCPPGLTPSQRRRIQRMRAQKMREEATERERDEHFNDI